MLRLTLRPGEVQYLCVYICKSELKWKHSINIQRNSTEKNFLDNVNGQAILPGELKNYVGNNYRE